MTLREFLLYFLYHVWLQLSYSATSIGMVFDFLILVTCQSGLVISYLFYDCEWKLWRFFITSKNFVVTLFFRTSFCNHAWFYIHAINFPCRSVTKVHDEWFADETRVRKLVGLLEEPVVHASNAREVGNVDIYIFIFNLASYEICVGVFDCILLGKHLDDCFCWQHTCGICFESHPASSIKSAACGHPFCASCWEG